MISTVLWDVDGTLLDFRAAEREAIRRCFEKFGMGECTDEMISVYSGINSKYWKKLECGEISKQQVLYDRFAEFFSLYGVKCPDIDDFNGEYQLRLGDTVAYNDDSYNLLLSLKKTVKQYAVTNGTSVAQRIKLEKSGFIDVLDDVFISDEVGIDKPNTEFFNFVLAHIVEKDKRKIMIVGDSLTSDIRGGNNAGIICCWYNPKFEKAKNGYNIDYTISNLGEVYNIIENDDR